MSDPVAICLVLPFALIAGSLVHEGGHWAMAAALRCEPRVVCLGFGRQLCQVRLFGVHLVLRAVPLGGHVLLVPMGRRRRNALAAVLAAGPAANMLAVSAALLVWQSGVVSPAIALVFVGGHAISLANTLLPSVDAATGQPDPTDGYKIFVWATGRDEDLLEKCYAPIVAGAAPERRPLMTADFAEALFHSVRPDRNEPWGRQQARNGLETVLERGQLNPYEHLTVQKRLQRDLEEDLRALIAQGEKEVDAQEQG